MPTTHNSVVSPKSIMMTTFLSKPLQYTESSKTSGLQGPDSVIILGNHTE